MTIDPEKPATPDAPPEVPPTTGTEPPAEAPKENTALIKDGRMTIVLELEGDPAAFAKSIGSLELAKDLVKSYFGKKAMVDAALRERSTIIKPSLAN